MLMTRNIPAKAYLVPSRKRRLDQIVIATSHRLTISKLLDECAEVALPGLEAKYLPTGPRPTHDNTRRRSSAA